LKTVLHVYLRPFANGFFAECIDLPISAQGTSLDQVVAKIQDSVQQYLKDNEPFQFGLAADLDVLVTMHVGSAEAE